MTNYHKWSGSKQQKRILLRLKFNNRTESKLLPEVLPSSQRERLLWASCSLQPSLLPQHPRVSLRGPGCPPRLWRVQVLGQGRPGKERWPHGLSAQRLDGFEAAPACLGVAMGLREG